MTVTFDFFDLNRAAHVADKKIHEVELRDIQIFGNSQMLHQADVIMYTDGKEFKVLKNRRADSRNYITYNKYQKGKVVDLLTSNFTAQLTNIELVDRIAMGFNNG